MKTLLLIDANALIHRSFHALPPLTTPAGEPINAVYGLASTLLKVLREDKPDYIAAAFDRPEPTFRKETFKEYKAQRPKAPDDLVSQIIKSHELVEKIGIKIFEQPGFEADDIIGTLTEKFSARGGSALGGRSDEELKIVILTGDLDTLQLVDDDKITVKTLRKGVSDTIVYNEEAVKERFGLAPAQLPDYKGLVGDQSDNIPGVPGVGPKTAAQILSRYQTLEQLYEDIGEGMELVPAKDKKLFEKLLVNKDKAILAKHLTTIKKDVNLPCRLEELERAGSFPKELVDYFDKLGFQSLIKRLAEKDAGDPGAEAGGSIAAVPVADADNKFGFGTVGFNLKERIKRGEKLKKPLFDLGAAAWLADPDLKDYSPGNLAGKFLKKDLSDPQEIAVELFPVLNQKIRDYELDKVFNEIEMPLVEILAEMELTGIAVDIQVLEKLKQELDAEIQSNAEKIYKEAGEVFNINSPKQLLEVFKRKFGLKLFSTAAEKLEAVRGDHPIVDLILQYRENFKIKSTYVEPVMKLTDKKGRLHTNFNQTGTATGRLSSSEPNLQNVPQGSKWAPRLRSAFVAAPGYSLAAFDYSQLELRILADTADDPIMKKSFYDRQDIHKLTAAQIFNVPLEKVTPEMRRLGKTLNFGIVYGMGADALSRGSGLKREEARDFIEKYFSNFSRIRSWQEEIKSCARSLGYVVNRNGRRRWFFDIQSFQPRIQAEAERAAINMPIQSLEADIIKLAMIKSREFLKDRNWLTDKARLLLSIHDELLFELSDDILKEAEAGIKKIMESAYPLSVPLAVESATGRNWNELKK